MTGLIKHYCTTHKDEKAVIYCGKCGRYFCESCFSKTHKDMNKSHSPTFTYVSDFKNYNEFPTKQIKTDDTLSKSASHVNKDTFFTQKIYICLLHLHVLRNSRFQFSFALIIFIYLFINHISFGTKIQLIN